MFCSVRAGGVITKETKNVEKREEKKKGEGREGREGTEKIKKGMRSLLLSPPPFSSAFYIYIKSLLLRGRNKPLIKFSSSNRRPRRLGTFPREAIQIYIYIYICKYPIHSFIYSGEAPFSLYHPPAPGVKKKNARLCLAKKKNNSETREVISIFYVIFILFY